MSEIQLGLDTFGDVSLGADGNPKPMDQVLRDVVDQAVLAGAIGLMLVWLVRRVQALREGRLANAHTLYMLSHFTMFAVGCHEGHSALRPITPVPRKDRPSRPTAMA